MCIQFCQPIRSFQSEHTKSCLWRFFSWFYRSPHAFEKYRGVDCKDADFCADIPCVGGDKDSVTVTGEKNNTIVLKRNHKEKYGHSNRCGHSEWRTQALHRLFLQRKQGTALPPLYSLFFRLYSRDKATKACYDLHMHLKMTILQILRLRRA